MAIYYRCRYCGTQIGELVDDLYEAGQLGFHHLTVGERKEMIDYEKSGDVLVKTVCEDCQEALERNPEYHELTPSFIQ